MEALQVHIANWRMYNNAYNLHQPAHDIQLACRSRHDAELLDISASTRMQCLAYVLVSVLEQRPLCGCFRFGSVGCRLHARTIVLVGVLVG